MTADGDLPGARSRAPKKSYDALTQQFNKVLSILGGEIFESRAFVRVCKSRKGIRICFVITEEVSRISYSESVFLGRGTPLQLGKGHPLGHGLRL